MEILTWLGGILSNGGIVAGIGLVGSFSVFAGAWLWRRLAGWLNRRILRYDVDLGSWPLKDGSVENVQLCCLLVRHGTDSYIERLASDQEKYEGRLRNRVLKNRVTIKRNWANGPLQWLVHLWKYRILSYVMVEPGSATIRGRFLLPVHQRLGTQFKLFFQVKGGEADADPSVHVVPKIATALAVQHKISPDDITAVREYRRWLRSRPPAYRFHLWFCIDSFGKTVSLEGVVNNMCTPV